MQISEWVKVIIGYEFDIYGTSSGKLKKWINSPGIHKHYAVQICRKKSLLHTWHAEYIVCAFVCDHTILETLVLCASLHIQAFKNAVLLHTPEVKCLKVGIQRNKAGD